MAISLNNEAKSKVSLTSESKNSDLIWDDADWSWDDDDSTWDAPKLSLDKESKSKVSLNNETR